MEKWQRNIIEKNKVELLKLTKCGELLRASFLQDEVISQEEEENLVANVRPTTQARQMYDIIVTRTGGFKSLIKGLQTTMQTGALDTLTAATLVGLQVRISGKILTVQEILPSFTLSDAKDVLLQDKGLKNELYKVIEDSVPVQLHLDMRKPHKYYIQRYIRSHNLNETKNNSSCISEGEFVDQLLRGCDSKGVLVCNVPGMGKSLLLENISRELQNKDRVAVFFVELSALSRSLNKRDTLEHEMEPLQFLLCYVLKSKLAVWLLQELRNKQMWRLIFVLDGFDEIRNEEVMAAISFLEEIHTINNILVIISSRLQKRQQLVNRLQLISYDIMPFTRKEQVAAIVGHWMENKSLVSANAALTEHENVSLSEFAEICIDAIKMACESDSRDILGVPLMCQVLSVINEVHAEEIIGGSCTRYLNKNEALKVKSIAHLYEGFVKALWNKAKLSMEDLEDITNFHVFHQASQMVAETSKDVFNN